MAGESKVTTDHEEIISWVESRGGWPATVAATKGDDEAGILRIDFPDYSGKDSLERVNWEQFFEVFDQRELAFLYQDTLKSGEESRFCKLVSRDSAD